MLNDDVQTYVDSVNEFTSRQGLNLNQAQFDMLVSYRYNYGQNVWTREKETVLRTYLESTGNNFTNNGILSAFSNSSNPNRREAGAEILNNGYKK